MSGNNHYEDEWKKRADGTEYRDEAASKRNRDRFNQSCRQAVAGYIKAMERHDPQSALKNLL